MGAQMKGLQQFILDLRSVHSKEEQDQRINSEIVNIQKQFSNNEKLSGYQRKKYISKLIFIYLTTSCNISTFNVTFGTQQILELISSKVYSEKFTGYLATQILFNIKDSNENELEFTNLIVNSIRNDLNSPDTETNALALQCIATLGNSLWADVLVEDVFQLLRSPTSSPLIKKRSSLALLKLVKSNKDILLRHEPWIPRILALVDDPDLGVVISVLPLIEFIATEIDFIQAQTSIPSLTKKLSILVLESDTLPKEHFFGRIANPWLIVKITKLFTILIPDAHDIHVDLHTLRTLRECVTKVIEFTTKKTTDSSVRNAHNAVLFSMINLAGLLNPSPEALESSIDAISMLLDSTELNTRYLALNSLTTLSSRDLRPRNPQKHLMKILHLLKEQDVSISKKSLDLIYTLANAESINFIIEELLKILKTSDHVIKQEIAIKISILAEKYASEPSWYVKTMLELIDNSGMSLNESIWERIVQIIVNNESLQRFSCKKILEYIAKPKFTEAMVKIATYIIGEFGVLITDEVPVKQQFGIFANIYFYVSNHTRVMILSTFLKMLRYNLDDKSLKSNVIKVLRLEVNSINSELQQRSFEYLTLIQKLNTKEGQMLFTIIFDEIPVFNTRENRLLLKLGQTNPAAKRELIRSTDNLTQKLRQGHEADLSLVTEEVGEVSIGDPFSESENSIQSQQLKDGPLTPNWQQGFYRLFEFNQGIFFENSLIKIILRLSKHKNSKDTGSLTLSFTNKSTSPLTSFTVSLTNYKTVRPDVVLNTIELPEPTIPIDSKTTAAYEVILRNPIVPFDEIPNLRIQFSSGGGFNSIRLKLPIFLTKFLSPTTLNAGQFSQHWSKIDSLGVQGETRQVVKASNPIEDVWVIRLLEKLGLSLVDEVTNDFLASGILHTKTKGNFGVLLKAIKLSENELEFTVRATGPGISDLIAGSITNFFQH